MSNSPNRPTGLTVYPSNDLDILTQLLIAVLSQRTHSILEPDTIIVDNIGMQHWLQLQLADSK
ncbi:MAG: exodeoxyribonuclease V subunit gamma, partial [Gammaproteobacteria bacterium]|nr:exodeoxyribonuclease V subunit gamma [Gammaproteobacteria bacterium]